MIDRRYFERVRRDLRISLKSEQVSFDGVTLDICPGGVFIISAQVLPRGSVVDMELWVSDGGSIRCRGEVTWVNRGQVSHYPPGFGVQFMDLSGDSLKRVLNACMERDADSPW
ncbi:MAG: PilZ domain-containing protein [Syntrophobacteraceae bacterium]|nr:PilZ domain-containing protein [Desulfobacteraceae bacterium]